MNSNAKTTDEYLAGLPTWQSEKLTTFRKLVHEASADITEEIKWGVPAFMHGGKPLFVMACFKNHVKYNFIQNGALLNDSHILFNNGLESAKSRAIDLAEDSIVDVDGLKDLIKQALK